VLQPAFARLGRFIVVEVIVIEIVVAELLGCRGRDGRGDIVDVVVGPTI
jgi:hypothetical protein